MIYILLMLILAVLLFGASAVIGFLGIVLGFIVAAIALLWASVAFGVEPWVFILGGAGFVIALIPLGMYGNQKMKEQQEAKDRIFESMTPESRRQYEEMQKKVRESLRNSKSSFPS